MKKNHLTPQALRQRKFLLLLPLLIIPFATLLFWALGGGKVNAANARSNERKGFNTSLPDAKLKDERGLDKLSYYDKASRDSERLRQQMKSDPYYQLKGDKDTAKLHFPRPEPGIRSSLTNSPSTFNKPQAANTAKVYQKLTELQNAVNKPVATIPVKTSSNLFTEKLPDPLQPQPQPEDPELKQMNGMLEKILDIQHPERLQQKKPVPASEKQLSRFNAIPAEIEGNQKITVGSVVKIKLLDSVILNGLHIPKGQLIYGSGTLANQRLTINLRIIHIGYTIIPVDLTVFDMTDGLEGISVPEAVTGEAIKEGSDNAVQGMEFMSLDQSMATQAASAGLNAAKGLFSKKVKRIKAKLKNGHPLLLRDNKKI